MGKILTILGLMLLPYCVLAAVGANATTQEIAQIKMPDAVELEDKRTENSRTWRNEKTGKFTTRIYSAPIHEKKNGAWYYRDFAPKSEISWIPVAYAQEFPADSRDISLNYIDASWATCRATTTGNGSTTALNTGTSKDAGEYVLARTFLPFWTNVIADDAVINSAALHIVAASNAVNDDNDGDDYIALVSGTLVNPYSPALADYDGFGTTLLSDDVPDYTGLLSGQELVFALNASGISAISLTAPTTLVLREGHDLENSAPLLNDGQKAQVVFTASGTATSPYLEIVYETETPSENGTSTVAIDTSAIEQKMDYLVVIGIVIALLLILDFVRRNFANVVRVGRY